MSQFVAGLKFLQINNVWILSNIIIHTQPQCSSIVADQSSHHVTSYTVCEEDI